MTSAFAAGRLLLGSVSCGTAQLECLNKDKDTTFLPIFRNVHYKNKKCQRRIYENYGNRHTIAYDTELLTCFTVTSL